MGPKRRGRPPRVEIPEEAPASKSKRAKKVTAIKTVKVPVTERDEELVECDTCGAQSTFREFRIHNLTDHYNIASTKDDTQKKDHRFYERCLKNMAKLKKIPVFHCPRENCSAKYKSALGLAFHLEQCGKTLEEIQANYVPCEHCGKTYAVTVINAHRKTHAPKQPVEIPKQTIPKRASAKKAQEKFKTIEGEGDEIEIEITPDRHDEEFIVSREIQLQGDEEDEDYEGKRAKIPELSPHDDITAYAYKTIATMATSSALDWEKPQRVTLDVFTDVVVNPLKPFESEVDFQQFLPSRGLSFQFKVKTRVKESGDKFVSTDFQRLRIFESQVTDSDRGNNVVNVGGPVSSLSWHPSGRFLCVAVLKDIDDKPKVHDITDISPTCIQFYEKCLDAAEGSVSLSLKLVLGVANGFIHQVQWSNFWPEENSDFVGHLAYACGDSSVEIIYVEGSSFEAPANVLCSEDAEQLIPMYRKTPEFRLILNSASREEAGKCTSFQWHEELRLLATGYSSGLVAIFDVPSRSRLLRKSVVMDDKDCTVEILPFWYIRAHTDVVSVVTFASFRSRYLISCSHDYYIKTWDLEQRREVESKKIGMVLDAVWIRGWVHLAVAADYANLNYQLSNFNAIKFFQMGSKKGVVNVPDHLNITSLSFFEGLVAEATELGRVTIAYYDQFLRECDYDRNKKKKNTIDFSSIEVEKPVPRTEVEDDPKLVISIHDSQRETHHSIPEPRMENYEDYIVYYRFVRANKVSWCPAGKNIATGYHNGLLVISPVSFSDKFFKRNPHR